MKRWVASAMACALFASACASGTEGEIVRVRFELEPEAQAGRELGSFETDTGWEITLERAEIALSAIYLFAPDEEPGPMARLSRALERSLVPVARAHGGHDPLTGKRVRAEWIEPVRIDLLDPGRRALGEVDAEAGTVASLALDIAEAGAEVTDELEGAAAFVEGVATREGQTIRFSGGLEVPNEGIMRRVERALEPLTLSEGDVVVIGIAPSVWLARAELDRLEASEDEPATITVADQVGRAWLVGARSPDAFSLHHERETERD